MEPTKKIRRTQSEIAADNDRERAALKAELRKEIYEDVRREVVKAERQKASRKFAVTAEQMDELRHVRQ